MKIITLLSDFGDSEYPAMMKGVILRIDPEIDMIDITHGISPQNVIEGSFVLRNAVKYFPEGTVHLAVVDPGVGGDRKPIVIRCRRGILVGPDNGLLVPASELLEPVAVYEITNTEFMLSELSATFHGRDIFAPAAAHLSADPDSIHRIGPKLEVQPVKLDIPEPVIDADSITGTIMHSDRFGNLVSNVDLEHFDDIAEKSTAGSELELTIMGKNHKLVYRTHYSEGKTEEMICLISSSGHLELAVPNGSASDQTGARPGERFKIAIKR